MTFGAAGGSPKSITTITDSPPSGVFTNRDVYQCPLDTVALIIPLLFSCQFSATEIIFKVKQIDALTGSPTYLNTVYNISSSVGTSVFINAATAETTNIYPQRYEKYAFNGGNGYGGGILLFPGEILSLTSSNLTGNKRIKYAVIEYGIAS